MNRSPNSPPSPKRRPLRQYAGPGAAEAEDRADGMLDALAAPQRERMLKRPSPRFVGFFRSELPPQELGGARGIGRQSRPGKAVRDTTTTGQAHRGGHELGTSRGSNDRRWSPERRQRSR